MLYKLYCKETGETLEIDLPINVPPSQATKEQIYYAGFHLASQKLDDCMKELDEWINIALDLSQKHKDALKQLNASKAEIAEAQKYIEFVKAEKKKTEAECDWLKGIVVAGQKQLNGKMDEVLHITSGGARGKAPTDKRTMSRAQETMVDEAVKLYKKYEYSVNKLSQTACAKQIIAVYKRKGLPCAYSDTLEGINAFRRAITRRLHGMK